MSVSVKISFLTTMHRGGPLCAGQGSAEARRTSLEFWDTLLNHPYKLITWTSRVRKTIGSPLYCTQHKGREVLLVSEISGAHLGMFERQGWGPWYWEHCWIAHKNLPTLHPGFHWWKLLYVGLKFGWQCTNCQHDGPLKTTKSGHLYIFSVWYGVKQCHEKMQWLGWYVSSGK